MIDLQGREIDGQHDSYEIGERVSFPSGRSSLFRVTGRPDLLFKQFLRPASGAAELQRLTDLTQLGIEVSQARSKSAAIHRIAWPRDLVVAGDTVTAVVIPYAGDRYLRPQIGKAILPRDLSYLRRDDEGVDDLVRLVLLRQLTGAMGALESAGLVHGDISHNNLLWAPPPSESLMLVDCDGLHPEGTGGTPAKTPKWEDPRKAAGLIEIHDMSSDWYALALAIWRTMATTGASAPPRKNGKPTLPRELPRRIREQLIRAFSDPLDPYSRPSPEEWAKELDAEIKSRGGRRQSKPTERVVSAPREPSPEPRRVRTPPPPVAVPPSPPPALPHRRRRVRKRSLGLAALFALAILLVVGALGDNRRGPQQRAETAVAHWARGKLDARGLVAYCPEKADLHAGSRYVCRVTTKVGAIARVRVRIGAERGIRRDLNVISYRRRAILEDIRAAYRNRRANGGRGLSEISCREVIPARPGTTVRCGARYSDGRSGRIEVHMLNRRVYYWDELGGRVGGVASALH